MSSFNGAGLFTISGSGQPYVAGTTISSTVANQLGTDLANGLSTCLLKDGTQTATAVIPFALGLSSAALVDLSTGTAGQIKFPSTQNSSSNVNTLDDYEEGIFTPTVAGDVTPGAFVYSTQVGSYTKIGRQVTFSCRVAWSSFSGAAGNITISPLPFTSQTLTGEITLVNAGGDGITNDAGFTQTLGVISSNRTVINIAEAGSTKILSSNGVANLPAAGAIYCSGSYFAAT